jgi:hypothetical protein
MALRKLEDLRELSHDGENLILDGKPVNGEPLGKSFCVGNKDQIPSWLKFNNIPEEADAYLMVLAGHSSERPEPRESLYVVQAYRLQAD